MKAVNRVIFEDVRTGSKDIVGSSILDKFCALHNAEVAKEGEWLYEVLGIVWYIMEHRNCDIYLMRVDGSFVQLDPSCYKELRSSPRTLGVKSAKYILDHQVEINTKISVAI